MDEIIVMGPKSTKLRPYRVDYFDISEMKGERAVLRSKLVRTPTAEEAKKQVSELGWPRGNRVIVRAHRFYKKLSKDKLAPVALETLYPDVRVSEVLEQIKSYRTTSGPTSPATVAVLHDFQGMIDNDAHEKTMSTFVPRLDSTTTTPRLQAAMGSKEPITVRTTDGQLGILDPSSPAQTYEQAAEAQPEEVAWYRDQDRTLNMTGFPSKIAKSPVSCPNCGLGTDTDGDGDCPSCKTAAYHRRSHTSEFRWKLGAMMLLLCGVFVCVYCILNRLSH